MHPDRSVHETLGLDGFRVVITFLKSEFSFNLSLVSECLRVLATGASVEKSGYFVFSLVAVFSGLVCSSLCVLLFLGVRLFSECRVPGWCDHQCVCGLKGETLPAKPRRWCEYAPARRLFTSSPTSNHGLRKHYVFLAIGPPSAFFAPAVRRHLSATQKLWRWTPRGKPIHSGSYVSLLTLWHSFIHFPT